MYDILDLVMEFYTIKQIEVDMHIDEFKNSHNAWLKSFENHSQDFINVFHNMIWDYTVLACAGELRHAKNCSTLYHPDLPSGGQRCQSMLYAKQFTRDSVAKAALDLFGPDTKWNSGYGGNAWYKIANVLNMVHKLPKDVWIDHCVDLAHNNGSYFNKTSAGVFSYNSSSKTKSFLDHKRFNIVWNYANYSFVGIMCSNNLATIINNAANLNILSKDIVSKVNGYKINSFTTKYSPVKWDKKELSNKYKKCGKDVNIDMREYRYEAEERYA